MLLFHSNIFAPVQQKEHNVQHDLVWWLKGGVVSCCTLYIKEQFLTLTNYGTDTICLTLLLRFNIIAFICSKLTSYLIHLVLCGCYCCI